MALPALIRSKEDLVTASLLWNFSFPDLYRKHTHLHPRNHSSSIPGSNLLDGDDPYGTFPNCQNLNENRAMPVQYNTSEHLSE